MNSGGHKYLCVCVRVCAGYSGLATETNRTYWPLKWAPAVTMYSVSGSLPVATPVGVVVAVTLATLKVRPVHTGTAQ